MRLVFEPKSSRQDPDEFITLLLAQTSLEGNVPMNLVMLGLDGRPRQKDLKSILSEWLDFRMHTVTRRLEPPAGQGEPAHPHPGRPHDGVPAYRGCDPRHSRSDEPKPELMRRFGLSDIQAEDILDIRLRQLARLEGFKLEKNWTPCARSQNPASSAGR